jgi:hypothetical protein
VIKSLNNFVNEFSTKEEDTIQKPVKRSKGPEIPLKQSSQLA